MPNDLPTHKLQAANDIAGSVSEPVQLPLDLAFRPALDREDFLISPCNAAAMAFIESWPHWPHYAAIICGPESCGKSHLGNVWRRQSGARLVHASGVTQPTVNQLTGPPGLVIEDVDHGPLDEQALFHLLNLARSDGFHVLMTARSAPGRWQMRLPDLSSRIMSAPVITIGAPDDRLLEAVLLKQFADRQLMIPPSVLSYISTRMERSMAAIGPLVAALDRAALASKRKITRPLAARVLADALKAKEA